MKIRSGRLTNFAIICCAVFCVANGALCSSSLFACNNGWNCIDSNLVCNEYDDCGDNSDEFGCDYCSSYQFRCFNGSECVDSTKACDGAYDCSDNSDESNCTYTCTTGSVRLVGYNSSRAGGYGRVEVCYNNTWGSICGDSGWNYHASNVVCNQLGFSGSPWQGISFLYGPGTGLILLSGLSCSGYETTLFNCSHGNRIIGDVTDCFHSRDASVRCASQPPTPHNNDPSASIGIGVGVSVLVVAFIVCIVLVVWRRKNTRRALFLNTAAISYFGPAAGYQATGSGYVAAGYQSKPHPQTI